MESSEKQELNSTQGDEVRCPCSECSGKTFHEVLLSVDKHGHEEEGGWDFYWDAHYQIIQCQGCKTVSFRCASSNSEDFDPVDGCYLIRENIYPSRIEGRRGIGDGTKYLPSRIQTVYGETLQALNSASPLLAGIGLRALIETVCKEEDAAGNNLFQKIDDLVTKNVLTPAGAGILHKLRTLGNEAAHEVKPHSDKQLGLAMDVVEHLLEDVYILPRRVEAEFKDDKA